MFSVSGITKPPFAMETLLEGSLKFTPLNVTLGGPIHKASVARIEAMSTMRVIRVQQKKRPQQRARDPLFHKFPCSDCLHECTAPLDLSRGALVEGIALEGPEVCFSEIGGFSLGGTKVSSL